MIEPIRGFLAARFVIVLLPWACVPATAAEVLFPATPDWSGPIENTRAIMLGDVDGDGWLDLVRGNAGSPSSLYRNVRGSLATVSSWHGREEGTQELALGDVNGDGVPDLVRANYDRGVTLYLGAGGSFVSDTAWMGRTHQHVAIGDVDGDGDLDLVATGTFEPATVYANSGGALTHVPATTGAGEYTQCLAVGDVDGDGNLDLVRGNGFSGSTLHLGHGGAFDAAAIWTGPSSNTTGLALGDVDGDGRLDLVCATTTGVTLYLNTGGTFAATRAWLGPPADRVALGDVDGDRDLDLVISGDVTELHLNVGGTFDDAPAWVGPNENTYDVALGDVDGDGDLDLVRGNFGQAATLYLNRSPAFAATPFWHGAAAHTHAVGLADVNGDGRLDLVRGNAGQPPTLDLNHDGVLQPATWTAQSLNTYGVTLADVDGDGRPDLVCANQNDALALFLNTGAGLSPTPSRIGGAERTWSVAIGDLDGDGDRDLVRGNQDQESTVYRNTGGVFDSVAALSQSATRAVALGDIDGDGRLDLVRGNYSRAATLHPNTGGSLGAAAAWTNPVETTTGVALGDVDGDGRLDLVRGNEAPGQTTLYLGDGSAFRSSPAWSGLVEQTSSVTLGDVDGDGRLDLVRGNTTQPSTLYLNVGGRFTFAPVWSAPTADTTQAVALGDLDGDGWLDLVCGNDASGPGGTTTRAFAHRSPWIVATSAGSPRRQLPNGPAWLRWARVLPLDPNRYRITFQAFDAESDPLWLIGEYQFEGSADWRPMELDGASLRTGPFTTSATGIAHEVAWDVASIPFDRRNVTVRLRAASLPAHGGTVQFIPSYLVDVGRVVPSRAELVAPGQLSFPTMTVGDSTGVPIVIANGGNQELVVTAIDVPDASVSVDVTLPLAIPAGGSRSVTVSLAPLQPLLGLGPLRLHSNDLLEPITELPLVADVRALSIETRLLATAPELPLGEAATVVVTPAPQVHLDGGALWFRPQDPNALFESAPLIAQGSNYVALVPGDRVTEAGLEYYVRVTNGAVVATDPASAPGSTYRQPVAAPAGITSFAQADSTGGYPVGRTTTLIVSLPRGARFQSATVFVRPGGASEWASVPVDSVELTPGSYAARVPGAAVGPRGLEYRVVARTLTQTLTDPAIEPERHPHIVRTRITDLAEASAHTAKRYRMLSFPVELGPPPPTSIEAVLFDDLGALDPTRWRAFRFVNGRYLEVTATPPSNGDLSPLPGRAFWVIARDDYRVDTAPITGRSVTTAEPYRIALEPGWNQIGNPFAFPITSPDTAEGPSGPVSLEPPVAWDEAAGGYDSRDVTVLQPFAGYWVRNPLPNTPIELRMPPVEAPASAAAAVRTSAAADSSEWRIQVTATLDGVSLRRHFAGVARSAREGADPFDRSEPPPAPESPMAVAFIDDGGTRRAVDIRPALSVAGDPVERGRHWAFDVGLARSATPAREVRLAFGGLDQVPAELRVVLVDRVLERTIDLRATPAYTCVCDARDLGSDPSRARFELLIGAAPYVETQREPDHPRLTRLLPIHPHPVRNAGIVRFETARPGRVALVLFDVAGRRVRTLVDAAREAGVHEVVWPGDRDDGGTLEPGVYLLRLTGPDRSDTRKLIKL